MGIQISKKHQPGTPTLKQLEEFVANHFDYIGTLEDFVEKHHVEELYCNDFETDEPTFDELEEFVREHFEYLNRNFHGDSDNFSESQF
jgi:hypothetical protein